MAAGFTYGTIHLDFQGWECQTSTGLGALGMDGIGSSARHVWRPISPSLNFCNFSFKRKVNETRMYDPVMSSFLSVDRYVQDPSNSQNFNWYAYCLNNPLRFTDPSGWQCRPTPQKNNYIDYTYQYLEPRDGDIGSPYMVNYFLNGVDCSGGVGGFGGGGGSSVSYGYAVNHPQFSAEQQFSLIRNWQKDPCSMNKWMLWYAGLSDINLGEMYWDGTRDTHLSWECDGASHTASIEKEYVGGRGRWAQTVSDLGGSGSYMPPGYNYAGSENLGLYNATSHPTLQLVATGAYVFDGHMKTAPGVYRFNGGQHVKIVVKNLNPLLGTALSLEDQSTYTYAGWLKGKQYTGDSYSFEILPLDSKSFDFYRFNNCPILWQFQIETPISDAACVSVEFYSEWTPDKP